MKVGGLLGIMALTIAMGGDGNGGLLNYRHDYSQRDYPKRPKPEKPGHAKRKAKSRAARKARKKTRCAG